MTRTAVRTHFDEDRIDAIFSAIDQCRLPGAAVAVAIDGLPVYRRGFGLANMELPVLLGPAMRMRIGSTTKHFTALAYLLLCEEGRAGLDDPIGRHVPEINAASREATVRQLMGHTSGIRDAMAVSMMMNGAATRVSDKDILRLYETIDDVDFAPGTSWAYNNGGYVLLTAAIERLAGEPLDEVLRKRIFEPVGMHDTMLRRWDTDFVPNSATLHFRTPTGAFTRDYMGSEISGAGGMVSTMDDMLRWLRHMDAPVVGSADSWKLMREPQRLRNGTTTVYGLGLVSVPYRGVETVSHGGGVVAGNSQMIKVPAAGLDISIAVNRADINGADLAYRIIDACVEGLDPRIDTAFEKRSGIFLSGDGARVVEFSTHEDMQLMAADGTPALPVTADEQGSLKLPDIMSFVLQTARFDADGLVMTEFAEETRLTETTPAPEARIADRAGRYRSSALSAIASITEDGTERRLQITGRHGTADYSLSPVTERIWKARSVGRFAMLGGIVTFAADKGGFAFFSGRMKGMCFAREAEF